MTDKTKISIRRRCAGSYEWLRTCDGAKIMDAEQGVMDHDPRAWLITFYVACPYGGWVTEDNEVTYTLREAKELAEGWAEALVDTDDQGYGGAEEY